MAQDDGASTARQLAQMRARVRAGAEEKELLKAQLAAMREPRMLSTRGGLVF